ncbi:MAG TPA: leucyl aminopeptidase [Planctomycetota bacterium]|nr:leucyl aminopeptidase [Planctomycetota bacterium]
MKLTVSDSKRGARRTDLELVLVFEGEQPELPGKRKLPPNALGRFKGEFRSTRVVVDGDGARLCLIGLGKAAEFDLERLRRAGALAARQAESDGAAKALLRAGAAVEKAAGGARQAGEALAEGALMGAYRFEECRSKPRKAKLGELQLVGGAEFRHGADRGRILAEANAFTRDLQNQPANRMRPRDMAAEARKLAKGSKRVTVRVHDKAALQRLKAGALLSVAAGSVEPPVLIHLVYKPKGRSKGRIALVGKGLTFDTGGVSIKPSAKMWDMKYDMSGGAAVLGAFHALRRLDVPFEVHGVVPSSENMPDAAATKPGDLVTAMNGTTIEVLNTDAEGRLILADALCYVADKVKPDTTIDLATLTGAVVMAVGHDYSGLFTSSDGLRDALRKAGDAVGERLWPLPLEDFHKDWMKGTVGDLKNIHSTDQGAGASAGAAFLAHFAPPGEWAHLDIAGAAWGGPTRDWVGGALGSGVGARLLVRYLLDRA